MARTKSVVLTKEEKKSLTVVKVTALKAANDAVKGLLKSNKEAEKAYAAATKAHTKALAAAQKEQTKLAGEVAALKAA